MKNKFTPAQIEKSIFAALAYFDLLNRPLTSGEIWQFLYQTEATKAEVEKTLQNSLKLQKIIAEKNGYYYFKNRVNLIPQMKKKQEISKQLRQKAKRVAKRIFQIPFVKMVAVYGSLSYMNAKDDSDIDLIIITQPGRIWTVRALVNLYLDFNRLRKDDHPICPNLFVSEEAMDLSKIVFSPPDLHLAQLAASSIPIIYVQEIAQKYQRENSNWLKKYFPNFQINLDQVENGREGSVKKLLEKLLAGMFGRQLEKQLQKTQTRLIIRNTQKMGDENASVMATDQVVKTHYRQDKHLRYLAEFSKRTKNFSS